MIITFFGHSSYCAHQGDEEKILSLLQKYADEPRLDFYLGGYGAFDAFAYSCAKKYKASHKNARLIFITPYLPPRAGAQTYDEIIYPELETVPPRFAIARRNKWMAEKADVVIAYIHHSASRAYKACLTAKKLNKTVINLAEQ